MSRPKTPKMAQNGPKMAREGSKMSQNGPNMTPRWPSNYFEIIGKTEGKLIFLLVKCSLTPRWPKMAPGWPRTGPKKAPRWPKMAPMAYPGASRGHLEAIIVHLGAILESS